MMEQQHPRPRIGVSGQCIDQVGEDVDIRQWTENSDLALHLEFGCRKPIFQWKGLFVPEI